MSYGSKYIGVFNSVYAGVFKALHLGAAPAPTRWAYNFDGVDDRGQLAFRAINPDGDNTFEFWSPISLSVFTVMIAQNITATPASREFQISCDGASQLTVLFGGNTSILLTAALGFKPSTKYGLTLIGNTAQVFEGGLDGTLVRTVPFTRGSSREPTAPTLIGCRANGAGLFAGFFQGIHRDVKINGVLYPIADRNQSIQLPLPTGLGAELITESVHLTPFQVGSQWTYLGGGRWQYIGDGSGNSLAFLNMANVPNAGYLEYEVESFTRTAGLSGMRWSATIANWTGDRIFGTVGKFRALFTSKPTDLTLTRNTAGAVITCIIKNISFKPLLSQYSSELVSNGGFSNTAGWTINNSANAQITGGELSFNTTAVTSCVSSVATQNGKRYEISYTIRSITSGAVRIILYGNGWHYVGINRSVAGTYTEVVELTVAGGSFTNAVSIQGGDVSNTVAFVDNVSVREIISLCNPLTLVNTTPDRWAEIEGTLPNTQWAYNFDGIDDFAYFNTPIYLTGDFDISVTIEGIINTSSGQDFLGSELRLKFSIEPATGRPSFLVGNGSNWIINHIDSSVNLYNGARYVLRGTKVGNIYTYYINGEQKYQVTNSSPVTPQISFIGRRHNAPIGYVRGEIFNININGGNWKLDEIATPIQLPSTYLLSNELLSNSELLGALSTSLPSWTRFNTAGLSYENGGLKISNNAAQAAAIRQTINTVAGESYIVEFVVPDTSTTQARITVNSGSVGNYSAGLAGGNFSGSLIKQRIIFTATDTTTTIDIYCNTLDLNRYINLKSISIKALGSYGLELCSNRPEGNFINTNSSAVDFAKSTARLTTVDMPVESNTNYLITSVGGISDRSRWQYRKVSDGLWYWGASSLDYKSVDSGILTLFTTPSDCNGLRIYYKSEAGTATNLSVKKVLNLTNPVIFNNMNSDRWVEVLE